MNALTRRLVTEVALAHKAAARANDWQFAGLVEEAYWIELHGELGWRMREKLLDMARRDNPEAFDEDGVIISLRVDLEVSRLLSAYLVSDRFLRRHPEWELHHDWGDLPVRLAEPQMELAI